MVMEWIVLQQSTQIISDRRALSSLVSCGGTGWDAIISQIGCCHKLTFPSRPVRAHRVTYHHTEFPWPQTIGSAIAVDHFLPLADFAQIRPHLGQREP